MMNPKECILFSGGAQGAEAEFGGNAEKLGIEEVNFTFAEHQIVRQKGVRVLNHEELKKGDVSLSYVSSLMHRLYPNTPLFRKVLQSIWYQVNNGQEIFVVGRIMDDNTVKGGTGWGAEFAKLCNKDLFVFDQEKNVWLSWKKDHWDEIKAPLIRHTHFTGTGTRFIEDNGRKAITDLFQRSFGSF
ncbi:MAG: hypothetical protein V1753_04800 [Pseudomonadota bacterium]